MNIVFKSTTTALVGLSMAFPVTGVHAQSTGAECSVTYNEAELPCDIVGRVANDIEEWRVLDLIRQGKAETEDQARLLIAERRTVAAQAAAAEQAAADQAAADQAAADQAAADQAAADQAAADQAAADQAVADQAAADQAAADQAAADQAAADQAAADQAAADQAAADQAAADQAAADQAVADQAAADQAVANQAATDQAAADQAAADQAAADQAVADQTAADQAAALPAQCAARPAGLVFPCQVGDKEARDEIEWRILTMVANGDAANNAEARAILKQRREERSADRASTAAAAAAAAESMELGETETITQDTVRQSDEEFDTAVTAADTEGTAVKSDSGLSKFEKALLVGLGAVVVGSVLKNGDKVRSRTGDRVVVESPTGDLRVLKDDEALLRRPGDTVQTQAFDDGSSRTIVTKPDGSQVITVQGRDGSVLQRVNVDPQGNRYVIIDDTIEEQAVVVRDLPQVVQSNLVASNQSEDALRRALAAEMDVDQTRRFSLRQVREISQVRALAPELELDAVRFETGSAAIRPEQARALANLGGTLRRLVAEDPRTVFLIEGHTDAVGDETYNLALSDRRAETVALALTEYFEVPPANIVTQGYGESALKVRTLVSEVANRRAVVRNISGLLR